MRSMLRTCVLMALVVVPVVQREPERSPRPEVGAAAPPFRLNDHEGRAASVGGKTDAVTVLAFYPKAMTPGCTKEVCSLRDAAAELKALGVRVFGLSIDDVAAQAEFVKQQELNFPLLSDPDGSAAAKYGVLLDGARYTQRVTFVIDREGMVRHVDDQVKVERHGQDLVALVKQLESGR